MRAGTGLSFALAVVLLAVGCGGGGAAVMSPHTLVNRHPPDQTEQVILDTLPRRGWTAETVTPGRIVAFLALRKHLLRLEIRYDAQLVAIYYVDSDGLKAHLEPNGQIYGHPAINKWTEQLATDISIALNGPAQTAGGQAPTATP
ncbi:MAG TPA: hypothetical protein VFX59_31585 [Polyangiales bacterium]|nr:hypothetical protein [Polyangiales bacterium]